MDSRTNHWVRCNTVCKNTKPSSAPTAANTPSRAAAAPVSWDNTTPSTMSFATQAMAAGTNALTRVNSSKRLTPTGAADHSNLRVRGMCLTTRVSCSPRSRHVLGSDFFDCFHRTTALGCSVDPWVASALLQGGAE